MVGGKGAEIRPNTILAGRLRAGTMLWTEDWFEDTSASEWSYLAARMRCAARLGGPDIQFGGYIVPRGPTGTAPRGTIGLLKKAFALIGGGAKGIDYFEFGPGTTRHAFDSLVSAGTD